MQIQFNKNEVLEISKKFIVTNKLSNNNYRGIRILNTYTSGKYYYEITINNVKNIMLFGICSDKQELDKICRYSDFNELLGLDNLGEKIIKGSYSSCTDSLKNNDTIGVCLDFDNQEIKFYFNGQYYSLGKNSFDKSEEMYPCFFLSRIEEQFYVNFGHKNFKYKLPDEYKPFDYKNAFWFSSKYLLKQKDRYYSIKPEFYNKDTNTYLSCEPDFNKNGINNLSELLKEKHIDILESKKIKIDQGSLFENNLNNNINNITNLKGIDDIKTQYSENIMPEMTSNNDHNIQLKCSSIYSDSYNVFGLFDKGYENEGKKSWATTNGITEGWIEIKFNEKINISKYTFESRTGHGFVKEELPEQWTLLASNNGKFLENGKENEDYYIIDKREDSNVWEEHEKREYLFFNNCEFLYYRFYFKTSKENEKWVCIDNIELMSLKDEFKYKFLIKKQEKYYTIKNNEILEVENYENTKEFFNKNGFNNFYLINKELLTGKFNDLDKVQILIFNNQLSNNLSLEYKLYKPLKPIDYFKGEIEIIQAREK